MRAAAARFCIEPMPPKASSRLQTDRRASPKRPPTAHNRDGKSPILAKSTHATVANMAAATSPALSQYFLPLNINPRYAVKALGTASK